MPELVTTVGGKPTINSRYALEAASNNLDLNQPYDFTNQLQSIEGLVRNKEPSITQGAISNCRGAWYEWLLAINLYNSFVKGEVDFLAVKLPNIARFDCAKLYEQDVYKYVLDLRKKLKLTLGIELISSNPDFVLIDRSSLSELSNLEPIKTINHNALELIDGFYQQLIQQCHFESIIGYIATKTSFRPDRRLQIVHEGSLTKATYVHIQTRLWEQNPKGIKYFGMSLSLNDRDRRALRTVATHSITTVGSTPDRAVDGCYQVSSTEELYDALDDMNDILSLK